VIHLEKFVIRLRVRVRVRVRVTSFRSLPARSTNVSTPPMTVRVIGLGAWLGFRNPNHAPLCPLIVILSIQTACDREDVALGPVDVAGQTAPRVRARARPPRKPPPPAYDG